jgi:hypothetical protein
VHVAVPLAVQSAVHLEHAGPGPGPGAGVTDDEALDADAAGRILDALAGVPALPDHLLSAAHASYAAAGLRPPRVIIAPNPMAMAFAAGFAAGILWLRKTRAQPFGFALGWPAVHAAEQAALPAAPQPTGLPTTEQATRAALMQALGEGADPAACPAPGQAWPQGPAPAAGPGTDIGHLLAWPDWFTSLSHELGAALGVDGRWMQLCGHCCWGMSPPSTLWWHSDRSLGPFHAFRRMLGLFLPDQDRYLRWNASATDGGFRIVHPAFCIVSEPSELPKVNGQGRPHCADGPSHRWRDGWHLYHWQGMRIPWTHREVIDSPASMTARRIENEPNAEMRRVMIERYGLARYVADSASEVVHELPADHEIVGLRTARLLRQNVGPSPDRRQAYFVDLLNSTPEPDGTVKRYMLRIDPRAYAGEASYNVHAAVASTWRNEDGTLAFPDWRDYRPTRES